MTPASEAPPAKAATPARARRVPVLLGADDDGSLGAKRPVQTVDLAALTGLVVLLGVLWGRARGVFLWVDEGISVGISSHAFTSIPGILRQDGSPPLYYLLLHVWMALFGSSEEATHLLSLGFALAAVPAGLWVGWSLFGRRVGWTLAALMALNPFLAYYANETRMYSLLVLLGLLMTATFVHAFVFRRRGYLPAFALLLTLLLYTHNWGFFVGIGAGLSAMMCALSARNRLAVLLDAVLAFGAAGLLYLPWVPTLLAQLAHTGAPFIAKPRLDRVRDDLLVLFGPREAIVALGIGAAVGIAGLFHRPWNRVAFALVAIAVLPLGALTLALLYSRHNSVWLIRYLAVVLAPMALLLAVGLARGRQIGVACLTVYALFVVPIGVKQNPAEKSNVKLVADRFGPKLQRGDLVVTDFGTVPIASYYLPSGLRYAEATGPVSDERRSDQRDGEDRLRAAEPRITLLPLVESLPVGGHVLVVCPTSGFLGTDEPTEFVKLIYARCHEFQNLMLETRGIRLDDQYEPDPGLKSIHAPRTADLFTKVSPT